MAVTKTFKAWGKKKTRASQGDETLPCKKTEDPPALDAGNK